MHSLVAKHSVIAQVNLVNEATAWRQQSSHCSKGWIWIVNLFQHSAGENEIERLLIELESITDEEAAELLAAEYGQYLPAVSNK